MTTNSSSDQDLQGLVHRLKDWLGQRMWMPDETPVSVPCNAAVVDLTVGEVRAVVDGLSATRGTCSSCRFWDQHADSPACLNADSPMYRVYLAMDREPWDEEWGCTEYEPQPTATEEASK